MSLNTEEHSDTMGDLQRNKIRKFKGTENILLTQVILFHSEVTQQYSASWQYKITLIYITQHPEV